MEHGGWVVVDEVHGDDSGEQYDPATPTPDTPVTQDSRRITPHSGDRPPKAWRFDVQNVSHATASAAGRVFERIVRQEKEEERLIKRIMYILRSLSETRRRFIGPIAFSRVPFLSRQSMATELIRSRIIHGGYLETLSLLSWGEMPGETIFDALLQRGNSDQSLLNFLSIITKAKAQDFVNFATPLIGKDMHSIQTELGRNRPFPLDYLNKPEDQNRVTPSRIADLISKVCQDKDLPIPESVRIVLANEFFAFLNHKFRETNPYTLQPENLIYTSDLVSMIREALARLDLNVSVAITFFANLIPDLALYLASTENLPIPDIPANSLNIPFVDLPCPGDHTKTAAVLNNVGEIWINSNSSLDSFRRELSLSQCAVLIHHEPPLNFPFANNMDMMSIRTLNTVFHVLVTNQSFFLSVVNNLRMFEHENIIYGWKPAGLVKVMNDNFSWNPNIIDINTVLQPLPGKDQVSISDIAVRHFDAPLCRFYRFFSAHARPSTPASNHHSILISMLYKAAVLDVRHHQPQQPLQQVEQQDLVDLSVEQEQQEVQQQQQREVQQQQQREQRRQQREQQRQQEQQLQQEQEEQQRQLEQQRQQQQEEQRLRRAEEEAEREAEMALLEDYAQKAKDAQQRLEDSQKHFLKTERERLKRRREDPEDHRRTRNEEYRPSSGSRPSRRHSEEERPSSSRHSRHASDSNRPGSSGIRPPSRQHSAGERRDGSSNSTQRCDADSSSKRPRH